jgi:hypothetical protein
MPLLGPKDPEDVRKLHLEVIQIVQQRFLIATLAVTVFGVLGSWIVKDVPVSSGCVGGSIYASSALLSLLLLALFWLSHKLRCMLRILTTYLIVTKASNWEKDWEEFRKKPHVGYTKAYASSIFMVLVGFSAFFPFGISRIYSLTLEPKIGVYACVAIGVVGLIFIYSVGYRRWFDNEKDARKRWEEIKGPDNATSPS